MKAIMYLKNEMKQFPGFLTDYKKLSDQDKADLKKWAVEEGKALGIEVTDGDES